MKTFSSLPLHLHRETQTVRHLTDQSLMTRMDAVVRDERRLTLEVIAHLIEIERRKLYLPYGYTSLLAYCRRRLGYSEPAALRRIRAARLIGEHPEIYERVEKGELTLTTVAKLNGVLTKENKETLLSEVAGKPQRDVNMIVAGLRPERAQPDRVRAVGVWTRTLAEGCQQIYRRSDGKKLTTSEGEDVETCYRIEFTASREFMKKVENLKLLLWLRYPYGMSFETLFELVMDAYAERNDPNRCAARRQKRLEKKIERAAERTKRQEGERPLRRTEEQEGQRPTERTKRQEGEMPAPRTERQEGQRPAERTKNQEGERATPRTKNQERERGSNATRKPEQSRQAKAQQPSRHIPVKVRDEVHIRDGGRCTYVGRDGTRCGAKNGLQIDHINPFGLGGGHHVGNLRLLCGRHNRLEAERAYGAEHMQRFRAETGRPPCLSAGSPIADPAPTIGKRE